MIIKFKNNYINTESILAISKLSEDDLRIHIRLIDGDSIDEFYDNSQELDEDYIILKSSISSLYNISLDTSINNVNSIMYVTESNGELNDESIKVIDIHWKDGTYGVILDEQDFDTYNLFIKALMGR